MPRRCSDCLWPSCAKRSMFVRMSKEYAISLLLERTNQSSSAARMPGASRPCVCRGGQITSMWSLRDGCSSSWHLRGDSTRTQIGDELLLFE